MSEVYAQLPLVQSQSTKRCTRCRQEKPLDAFSPNRISKDGRTSHCKACCAEKKQVWRDANPKLSRQQALRHYHLFHKKPPKEPLPIPSEKRCNGCDAIKTLSAFPRAAGMRDGRLNKCFVCMNSDRRAQYAANPERVKRNRQRFLEQHPDYDRQKAREHYARCDKEHAARVHRAWIERNPGYRSLSTKKRRAMKKGAPVCDLTPQQWRDLLGYFQNRCAYCGEEKHLCQEHLVPLSRGGSHTVNNIVPACRECNSRKHARPLWVMVQS